MLFNDKLLKIEQIIESKEKQIDVENHIRNVAKELGIHLISEEELKKFTRDAESKT